MTLARASGALLALTVAYVGVLLWADSRNGMLAHGAALWSLAPALFAASFTSYLLRYARWRWLLHRAGCRVPVVRGFLAYLAGFAFTATPGKIGELLRVRYYAGLGVPGATVVAAFVFERALDLVVVLALASLYIARPDLWILAAGFVAALLACLAAAGWRPGVFACIGALMRRHGAVRTAGLVSLIGDGLARARCWLTVPDLLVSLVFGFGAWLLTSWAFLHLLDQLVDVPISAAQVLAMYPLAMLAGAGSMLPGGIGSTEAVLMVLLAAAGIPLAAAAIAAVGIRLATLWFAIACGIVSAAVLEWGHAANPAPADSP